MGLGVSVGKCNIIDFTYGDITNDDLFWIDALVCNYCFISACKYLDYPINIK